jgi:hypothetical protein
LDPTCESSGAASRHCIGYFGALALLVAGYLALVEVAKRLLLRHLDTGPMECGPARPHRHVRRRAARFSTT